MDREGSWSALMRAARDGDEAAYAALLTEVASALRGVVGRRLSRLGFDPQEAEDIVQETLIGMHLKRGDWDARRPILPWVHAIARHKMLDAVRRSGRARRGRVAPSVEDLADVLPAQAIDHRPERDVERLLARLPERQRAMVRALTIEGEPVASVARRFEVGEGAVRVALHRGLRRLEALAGADPRGEEA